MFKQITNLNGDEMYLIVSLWIFIIFFALVACMLIWMNKDHITYMKSLPFEDSEIKDIKERGNQQGNLTEEQLG